MSKAILVLDEMPKNCGYCQFHAAGLPGWCNLDVVNYRDIENEDIRQKWCPLKPIPQRKTTDLEKTTDYSCGWEQGYNACINEITGEEEI